jgi:hypothetical protein
MPDDHAVSSSSFRSPAGTLRRAVRGLPGAKRVSLAVPPLKRKSAAANLVSPSMDSASTSKLRPTTAQLPKPPRTIGVSDKTRQERSSLIPLPKKARKKEKRYLRDAMAARKCIIVADTLDSDGWCMDQEIGQVLTPFHYLGLIDNSPRFTMITPETLLEGMTEETNRYHAWVAVKQAMETRG